MAGHGGRDKMMKHLGIKYANITREAVELFKSFCSVCQQKRKRPTTKGVVVKPILSRDFGSRSQVILSTCNHPPRHISSGSLFISAISQSYVSYGLEASNKSGISAVGYISPVRSPCNTAEGSVERANGDIKDILAAWMTDNHTQDWLTGIRFVQNMKNSAYQFGIKRTPYAATFGTEPKVGLTSSSLPSETLERLQTEDDLLAVLSTLTEATTEPQVPVTESTPEDPNVIAEINNLYTIAMKTGILTNKYLCNQFDLCPQRLLSQSDTN